MYRPNEEFQEVGNFQVLIRVDDEKGNVPSQKFLDIVNSAASAFKTSDQATGVYIVSSSQVTALYAKIILHSCIVSFPSWRSLDITTAFVQVRIQNS